MLPIRDNIVIRLRPTVTWLMVGLTLTVFLWQATLVSGDDRAALYRFGLVPGVLFGHAAIAPALDAAPAMLTLVTSMFLHGGIWHLVSNLVYLWIFAPGVEDALGHRRFLAFYLTGGMLAALAYALTDPTSTAPMIGASGAISAVLGAYLMLYPKATITLLVPFGLLFLDVGAGWLLAAWLGLQLFGLAGGSADVAFAAHLGGFVAGMVLVVPLRDPAIRLFGAGRRRGPWG
ncbi:rhomboid family intramembrane serine protease [Marinivivus vitaminiproducens]|uniref:rhomboid family intramembrane serine protease n=1 Tax=Marinivivus vitaminiproducens TaxID=3035935 RepID=UPI0027A14BD7|nr:rhomboid family intramembrane serine protease [Geminicoccaceae bacterium SCSIO 64248]